MVYFKLEKVSNPIGWGVGVWFRGKLQALLYDQLPVLGSAKAADPRFPGLQLTNPRIAGFPGSGQSGLPVSDMLQTSLKRGLLHDSVNLEQN